MECVKELGEDFDFGLVKKKDVNFLLKKKGCELENLE